MAILSQVVHISYFGKFPLFQDEALFGFFAKMVFFVFLSGSPLPSYFPENMYSILET